MGRQSIQSGTYGNKESLSADRARAVSETQSLKFTLRSIEMHAPRSIPLHAQSREATFRE
jgi:hypothetical protein